MAHPSQSDVTSPFPKLKISLERNETRFQYAGEPLPFLILPSVLPAYSHTASATASERAPRFRATKQIILYFLTAARIQTAENLILTFSSREALSEEEISRLLACAKAAGVLEAKFESAEIGKILVTDLDFERIHNAIARLTERTPNENYDFLSEELDRAQIIFHRDVPPTLVTMNSTIEFVETETNTKRQLTLVYPQDADMNQGRVSILAPIGTALLGLRTGESIEWSVPRRQKRRLQVLAIPYQPEAFGHWHL